MPPAVWICSPAQRRPDFSRAYLESILASHGLGPLEETSIDASWTALRIGRFVPGGARAAGVR
jgi:hypothetical protein